MNTMLTTRWEQIRGKEAVRYSPGQWVLRGPLWCVWTTPDPQGWVINAGPTNYDGEADAKFHIPLGRCDGEAATKECLVLFEALNEGMLPDAVERMFQP